MENLNNITVTEITGVITVNSPYGRTTEMKNRRCYGLSFCISGQITYIQNGKKYVSKQGTAVFLPKNCSYTIQRDKTGLFTVINFDTTDFLCDEITVLRVEDNEAYIKDFEQMKNLFLFENSRAKMLSIFYNIINRLIFEQMPQTGILAPAVRYIEKNISDAELDNGNLAKMCKVSEVYFRRLFTKQFKMTPHKYIVELRIAKAKQLLADGVLKTGAVAEECGFSNPYHFCRVFKEKTGVTPSQYANSNKIYKI